MKKYQDASKGLEKMRLTDFKLGLPDRDLQAKELSDLDPSLIIFDERL